MHGRCLFLYLQQLPVHVVLNIRKQRMDSAVWFSVRQYLGFVIALYLLQLYLPKSKNKTRKNADNIWEQIDTKPRQTFFLNPEQQDLLFVSEDHRAPMMDMISLEEDDFDNQTGIGIMGQQEMTSSGAIQISWQGSSP